VRALVGPSAIRSTLRQRRGLERTEHRPWPLPERPWLMAQTWADLLFMHWRVDVDALRAVVPAQLPLDEHDGSAWVGVTPFRVRAFRLRGTPPLPVVHAFDEVNVRTYATVDGRPGIYFFSLDASSRFAVESARRLYRLPYFRSRISMRRVDDEVRFASERRQADGPPARLAVRYSAAGEPEPPEPGSLEHFLTERYCLYTLDEAGRVLRGDIAHPPWRIAPARAHAGANSMGEQVGLALDGEPLLHLAAPQDVLFWTNRPV
jgi:uncharacterized protein YqjF (DUF2071 family)